MAQRIIPGFDRILHGADYNPEQWLGTPGALEEDRRLRRLSGCNVFSIGIFSWSHLEPEEGRFEFGWLDRVMDELAEDGCRAILATPTAARPPWLAKRHPEVMRVNRERRRELFSTRHNFCWESPVFREKAGGIIRRLAARYRGHPALGLWHVSNELGGYEGNGECFCELCLARWREWLKARYGTIDALNEAWWSGFWGHKFSGWDEINPSDPALDACALDWSRFVNGQIRGWFEFEASILREITPGVPVTTNFMGVHPWIDYAHLAEAVDVVADDQYPALAASSPSLEDGFLACAFKHELQRCYKPGRPFMLMESCPDAPQWKTPQTLKHGYLHEAEMLQAVGHGAEGTLYFQWRKGRGGVEKLHGAVVDHSGSERARVFQTVARLSALYDKLRPVLGSARHARVALLYCHDTRRALALTDGAPHGGHEYLLHAQEFYRPFWRRGVAVDVFDSRRPGWERYPLVIAPHLFLLHPGVAPRLADCARRGGVVAATCLTGWVDENNKCLTGGWPGDGLRDLFGVWLEELDRLPDGASLEVKTEGEGSALDGRAFRLAGAAHSEGAEILARFGPGPFVAAGQPAIFRRAFGGGGAAWFCAGEFDRPLLSALADKLLREAGVAAPFPGGLPEGVVCSERGTEAGRRFLFLSNTAALPVRIALEQAHSWSVLAGAGETGSGTLTLPGQSSVVLQGSQL